uniref:Family with sequence similarity 81 member B n=1 Tax=Leptobrachium leishanense TaxID=445787 RepID=A0A8C5M050_9ANUR
MSRENSVQLVTYPDRGHSFLPAIPTARVEGIEDRIFNQEKTTTILLDQAFKIKDDVSKMRGMRGSQWDTVAQRFIENHMQTITEIVKQLSRDIEALENQIRTRDNVSSGTSYAVQSLDKKHLFDIGDLRGRVARCDASIAKLSGDLVATKHELQAQEKEIRSISAALESQMKEIDIKVMQLLEKMETSISQHSSKVRSAQGEQHHEIQLLDFKFSGLIKEVQDQIQNRHSWAESQLQKSEQARVQHEEQLLNSIREKMDSADHKFQESLHHITIKMEDKNELQRLESRIGSMKVTSNKMSVRIMKTETAIWDELENMKSEYRAGFQAIQESLNTLQQIQETKVKLETKKVQKDIKQIRRKIVELNDA